MAKSGPKSTSTPRGTRKGSDDTRNRLLDAALETLVADGYAGASARAVAGRAGCNQAVIYYHYDSVDDLLVRAVNHSGERRLESYRQALDGLTDVAEIVATWKDLHREDIDSGHLAALTEVLGGVTASPTLREGLHAALGPNLELIRETLDRVLGASGLEGLVPVDAAADTVFSLYLGVGMLSHVDGNAERPEQLFDAAQQLLNQAGPLLALLGGARATRN